MEENRPKIIAKTFFYVAELKEFRFYEQHEDEYGEPYREHRVVREGDAEYSYIAVK